MSRNSGRFRFDGGAATYLGTGILAFLVTVLSLGILLPFGIVLRQRWRCKHTYIDGQRLIFTGSGIGLFGNWIKWFLLIIVTFGIYSFWVGPRIQKWVVENTDFDPAWQAGTLPGRHAQTGIAPVQPQHGQGVPTAGPQTVVLPPTAL